VRARHAATARERLLDPTPPTAKRWRLPTRAATSGYGVGWARVFVAHGDRSGAISALRGPGRFLDKSDMSAPWIMYAIGVGRQGCYRAIPPLL
jgi:hypothetical protein